MACHNWRNAYMRILGNDRQETEEPNTWEDLQQQPDVVMSRAEYDRYLPLFTQALPATLRSLDRISATYADQLPTRFREKILDTATQLETEAYVYTIGYAPAVGIPNAISARTRGVLKELAALCRESERLKQQLTT